MMEYYGIYPQNDFRYYLQHHGVKNQKWGVRNAEWYPIADYQAHLNRHGSNHTVRGEKIVFNKNSGSANSIAKKIKNKVDADSKPPVGNQNCQVCTWCMEAQMRGMDILPRPVYSPRDVIFKHKGYEIVKNPVKESISNIDDVTQKVQKHDNSRYYAHVGWKDSKSGHEFIVANIGGIVNIIDPQDGLVAKIDSKKGSYYFDNADFSRSYLVRMDNKKFNKNILKFNDMKYCIDWDDDIDIEYLEHLRES